MANSKIGRGSNWSVEENRLILVIWARADIQACFDGSVRDAKVYNKISAELASEGFDRNAAQIKNKMKKMKQCYKECKDHNSKSGNNRKVIDYFDELDAILGHRPSVFPSVMLESMRDCEQALPLTALSDLENDTFAVNDGPDLDFAFDEDVSSAASPLAGCSNTATAYTDKGNTLFLAKFTDCGPCRKLLPISYSANVGPNYQWYPIKKGIFYNTVICRALCRVKMLTVPKHSNLNLYES